MADYLTFLPEKSPKRNLFLQIVFELLYGLRYLLLYIPGLLLRPSDVSEGEKRPVVLISGLMGSPLTWNRARTALIQAGHPVYVLRLGFQCGNLRKYSQKLQQFLDENQIRDCYLVCHSMGGLVAAHMGYKGRDRTRKIFTLGTPYRGHWLALLFPFTYATLQMVPFSPFMKETIQKYRTLTSIQAVFAVFDEILFTKHLNIPGRFDDVKLNQIGHCNLFMGPSGIECITELIAAEEAKDPKPVVKKENKNATTPVVPHKRIKKATPKKTSRAKSKKTTKKFTKNR